MTSKLKALPNKSIEKPPSKNVLTIIADADKSKDRQLAEIGLSTTVLNAVTASSFTKRVFGEISLTDAVQVMKEKVNEVNTGDLKGLEATLTAQASSLDIIFNALAARANDADIMPKLEIYMRLALKAQAQCARTIEVISAMKNPPVIYAKQANISNGNQQVNNGSLAKSTSAPAGKNINPSNELLEEKQYGSTPMDIRATQTTSRKNKTMATVEQLNRGKNISR